MHTRLHAQHFGFTLIELMIVIVILGIIVMLATGSFMSSQIKSRDSRRKGDLRQVTLALETYYNDKGKYPSDNGAGRILGCGVGDVELCDWDSPFVDSKGSIYMPKLPMDPKAGFTYHYVGGSGNSSYQLYGTLENTDDKAVQDASGRATMYGDITCGSKNCNYGVSSSNTTPNTGRTIVYVNAGGPVQVVGSPTP